MPGRGMKTFPIALVSHYKAIILDSQYHLVCVFCVCFKTHVMPIITDTINLRVKKKYRIKRIH